VLLGFMVRAEMVPSGTQVSPILNTPKSRPSELSPALRPILRPYPVISVSNAMFRYHTCLPHKHTRLYPEYCLLARIWTTAYNLFGGASL